MNILIYENNLLPEGGGVERASFNLATLFRRHGLTVTVAHRVDVPDDAVPDCYAAHLRVNTDVPDDARRLAEFAHAHHVDIIIHQQAEILAKRLHFWQTLRRLVPVPFIGALHLPPSFYRRRFQYKDWRFPKEALHSLVQQIGHVFYPKDRYFLQTACDLPDRLLFLSAGLVAEWEQLTGRHAPADGKIRVMPNFLPDEPAPPATLADKQKTTLFVGRMAEIPKQVSVILRLWRELAPGHPDWSLQLLGNGPDLPYYRKLAADLPRVTFTGQTTPAPYYRRASAIFLTSLWEGLPMVLLEAMRQRVVPVTFDSFPAIHDLLPNGVGGIAIPNRDFDRLVAATSTLMDDDAYRARLAEQATQTVSDTFSENALWPRWQALLAECLQLRPTSPRS